MSKVLNASIEDGKVIIDGVNAEDVSLLLQAAADSSGYVIISDSNAIYLANTQPDTLFIKEKLAELADYVSQNAAVSVPANVPLINTLKAEVEAHDLL